MTNLAVIGIVELVEIAATVLAAAAGVVAAVWRWAKKIERKLDKHTDRFAELSSLHDQHKKRLTKIEQVVMLELTANGGDSMRDRMEQVLRIVKHDDD